MDKATLVYTCQSCGALHPRWQGKCSACGGWNTLQEETQYKSKKGRQPTLKAHPIPINEIEGTDAQKIPSGLSELDYVLGGGCVTGSIILLGGEPGIGKSTLALQVAQNIAQHHLVLYITGEESAAQIQLRAARLGVLSPSLMVLTQTNLSVILDTIKTVKPDLVILDSIQVVYHPDLPAISGSVNQVRYCASELITVLKDAQSVGVLIGHITKEGALAGPKVLEHLVDVILVLEGERNEQYRTLRSFKNRYSSTNEVGLLEMKPHGLVTVDSPSGVFVEESSLAHPGSVVSSVMQGSRSLLVEVQALVVHSGYGMGKRTFLGVDTNRAYLLIAAIEKILGIRLADKDIILNIVGGIKTSDPALDLALILAIISSLNDKPIGQRIGVCGEISLTGEIRPIRQTEKRVIEFQRMGFEACILPRKNDVSLGADMGIKPLYVETLKEALILFTSL